MTKKFYHATPWENLNSILEKGIQPDCFGTIFLADGMVEASSFLLIRGISPLAVFEIELDEDEVEESFDHNSNFFKCKAWTYEGEITVDKLLNCYKVGDE